MSFMEKSAWAMAAVMLATGTLYLYLANLPGSTPPAAFVPYVLSVIVLSIAVQVGLAIFSPREAQAPADERERKVTDRAGHLSGIVLAAGLVTSMLAFLTNPVGQAGLMLFHRALLALIAAQLLDYAMQIYMLRRQA